MSELSLEAERLKLGRLLGCEASHLAGLSVLGVDGLRKLRAACTSTLYDGDKASFHKVVQVAKLMPIGLNALIAEKAMGPVIASRVAGLLPPQQAVDMARRVSLGFNVEVTRMLDPRSAVPMLKLMPVELVVGVTRELAKQKEFITMARFVDALTDEQLRASMGVLDDESLLRVGFFVESPSRLEETVALLPPDRLRHTVAIAAEPAKNLAGAALSLLEGVSDRLRGKLVEAAMTHADPEVGLSMIRNARERGMLEMFAPIGAHMEPAAAQRLAELLR